MKKHLLIICCILIGYATIFPSQTSAAKGEGKKENSHYWLNFGFGPAKPSCGLGVTGSYHSGWHVFSARFLYTSEVAILGSAREFAEGAIMTGLIWKNPDVFASVAVGLGYIHGKVPEVTGTTGMLGLNQQYADAEFSLPGFPVEVQLFWTPLSELGVGIYAFADFNAQEHLGGALVCIQIGYLRPAKSFSPKHVD
jgi:hypothetical protein